jgi:two-component system sensor histidine kinase QseC
VDRTSRLVRQLLALAKMEAASAVTVGSDSVRAGDVLRDIVDALPAPAAIEISIDPGLDRLVLPGDREILHLILRNLHENAIDHMPNGGRVAWKALPDGKGLTVEDEGPGIPEEEIDLVTRRFYRGRHKSPSGSGLGLTITQMAANRLGARLTLTNRRDRDGLRVRLAWS